MVGEDFSDDQEVTAHGPRLPSRYLASPTLLTPPSPSPAACIFSMGGGQGKEGRGRRISHLGSEIQQGPEASPLLVTSAGQFALCPQGSHQLSVPSCATGSDYPPPKDGVFLPKQSRRPSEGSSVPVGKRGGGGHLHLVPDTRQPEEGGEFKRKVAPVVPEEPKGSAIAPSLTGAGICAPRSATYSPGPLLPTCWVPGCFLLTHLSLPRGRKGSEARGPDPWGPPPSCFSCILLSSS